MNDLKLVYRSHLEPIAQSFVDLGWAIRGMVVRGLEADARRNIIYGCTCWDRRGLLAAKVAVQQLAAMAMEER